MKHTTITTAEFLSGNFGRPAKVRSKMVVLSIAGPQHSNDSKIPFGVFDNTEAAIKSLKTICRLRKDDIMMLRTHGQTQGRDDNYMIDPAEPNSFLFDPETLL